MKIIIAGAGEVGFHLAKLLSYESQEITLIDLNKDSLVYADTHLDIKVIKGDATSISVLKDARILNSDLFISVTSSETSNITACVLAKQLGAKRTIARISNTEFINHKDEVGFTKFGIDELISPESLAAAEIELLLSQSVFNDTYEFEEGALTMLGLSLSKDAKIINKSVRVAAQLLSDIHFIPIAIQRFGSHLTIIPRGDTIFKDGDRVVFITSKGGDEDQMMLSIFNTNLSLNTKEKSVKIYFKDITLINYSTHSRGRYEAIIDTSLELYFDDENLVFSTSAENMSANDKTMLSNQLAKVRINKSNAKLLGQRTGIEFKTVLESTLKKLVDGTK